VENLGKMYTLYNQPSDRLKHTLLWRFGRDFGHPFWALRDVSFEVHRGETFGIIGRNGSGKSTLLQILAGTLKETRGRVVTNGLVAALLELGSGFNPEFTGRENILLNGMILGLSRQEMSEKYDEIVAFADIGEFIDQPVKLYSSGMFVRLAFAIAASVEADILLVDEALAVGDIFFRQKCYRRLEALRKKGVSIVLVSHAMNEVEQFCERAILLDNGEAAFLGPAIEAVKRYYLIQAEEKVTVITRSSPSVFRDSDARYLDQAHLGWPGEDAFFDISDLPQAADRHARCSAVALCDANGNPCRAFQQGETACFFFEFELFSDIDVPIGGAEIVNEKGVIVHGKNSLLYGSDAPGFVAKGSWVRFRQDIRLEIHPGEYTFNVGFSTILRREYERRADLPHPELDAKIAVLNILPDAGKFAVVPRAKGRPVQMLHFGAANLQGQCQIAVVPPWNAPEDGQAMPSGAEGRSQEN
jgi:ABC-type polysaccharide/polyol phosphate transport system ATPase subunit